MDMDWIYFIKKGIILFVKFFDGYYKGEWKGGE